MTSNKFNITSAKYAWPRMFVQKEDGLYILDKDGERLATDEEIKAYLGPIKDDH